LVILIVTRIEDARNEKPKVNKWLYAFFWVITEKKAYSIQNMAKVWLFSVTVPPPPPAVLSRECFNPLKPELNPICYLLALLLAHHFLHVSRIRVK
jgi:hypothetical protein